MPFSDSSTIDTESGKYYHEYESCYHMFDVYESIISFTNEYAQFLSEPVKRIFRSFGAFAVLTDTSFKDLTKRREAFFVTQYPGSGDALSRILRLDDETEKEAAIRFLYLDAVIFDKLPQTSAPKDEIEQEMAEKLKDPELLSRLIGFPVGDTPIKIHISQMEPRAINLHVFEKLGIFLSVGADIDLDQYKAMSEDHLLAVFKALADGSRLRIVQALLKNHLTTSEIATRVDLTLSTVNHHLKQLVEANIVGLDPSSKAGKGALYTVNKTKMHHLLDLLRTKLD